MLREVGRGGFPTALRSGTATTLIDTSEGTMPRNNEQYVEEKFHHSLATAASGSGAEYTN